MPPLTAAEGVLALRRLPALGTNPISGTLYPGRQLGPAPRWEKYGNTGCPF